jgi:hypothetical protein
MFSESVQKQTTAYGVKWNLTDEAGHARQTSNPNNLMDT